MKSCLVLSIHLSFGFLSLSSLALPSPSFFYPHIIFIISSYCMSGPLEPIFLHFPSYFSRFRCPTNSSIPDSTTDTFKFFSIFTITYWVVFPNLRLCSIACHAFIVKLILEPNQMYTVYVNVNELSCPMCTVLSVCLLGRLYSLPWGVCHWSTPDQGATGPAECPAVDGSSGQWEAPSVVACCLSGEKLNTVKPRYNAAVRRHLLGSRYKRGAL